jgi:hypothetical protein
MSQFEHINQNFPALFLRELCLFLLHSEVDSFDVSCSKVTQIPSMKRVIFNKVLSCSLWGFWQARWFLTLTRYCVNPKVYMKEKEKGCARQPALSQQLIFKLPCLDS